jgi:hypothetical protein
VKPILWLFANAGGIGSNLPQPTTVTVLYEEHKSTNRKIGSDGARGHHPKTMRRHSFSITEVRQSVFTWKGREDIRENRSAPLLKAVLETA